MDCYYFLRQVYELIKDLWQYYGLNWGGLIIQITNIEAIQTNSQGENNNLQKVAQELIELLKGPI